MTSYAYAVVGAPARQQKEEIERPVTWSGERLVMSKRRRTVDEPPSKARINSFKFETDVDCVCVRTREVSLSHGENEHICVMYRI